MTTLLRLLVVSALVLGPGWRVAAADVDDGGGFFSPTALKEANTAVQEIEKRFGTQVVIETFKAVPAGRAEAYKAIAAEDKAARGKFFFDWAAERYQERKVSGAYVLVCRDPSYFQTLVGNATARTAFSPVDRNLLAALLNDRFRKAHAEKDDAEKAKVYDRALLDAVKLVRERVEANAGLPPLQPLFSGKDLSGWTPYNCELKDWEARDGILSAPGTAGKEGWLVTDKEYDDFQLVLECRLSKRTNTGVAFRAPLEGKSPARAGLEIQLLDDESYPGRPAAEYTGGIWNLAPPTAAAARPVGEWNQLVVTARGTQVTVVLNGSRVLDANLADHRGKADQMPGVLRRTGRIALQTYTGAAEFRNLAVRSLTQTGAVAARGANQKPALVLDASGHSAPVKKVVFTPDGKYLVSVSEDKTARLWDVATGETVHVFRLSDLMGGPEGKLWAAAVSPDGKWLAVGGYSWEVYVIDLAGRRVERVLTDQDNSVSDLQFSPNGKNLAVARFDGKAHFYSTETWRKVGYIGGHTKAVCGVAFSPDGTKVVTVSADKTGRLVQVKDKFAVLAELTGHSAAVTSVSWKPDGEGFATSDFDGDVRLWTADGVFRKSFKSPDEHIGSVTYTPDSKSIVYTTCPLRLSQTTRVDAETGELRSRVAVREHNPYTAAVSPDGLLVASGSFSGRINLWKAAAGEVVHTLRSRGDVKYAAGWSMDGQSIAWGDKTHAADRIRWHDFGPLERSLNLVDFQFGTTDRTFVRGVNEIGGVAGDRKSDTEFTFMKGWQTIGTVDTGAFRNVNYRSAALLPSEEVLLGLNNGAVGLARLKAVPGEPLAPLFHDHTSTVWALAPSPDGRYFLSASQDQTLKVWSFKQQSAPLLSIFPAGNEWVAWTPEGYYACSPGGEQLMGWRVDNGPDQLATFHPAERFRNTFYRPDVIKLLLKEGSTERALAAADKERGAAPTRKTEVAQVLPPKVTVTAPTRGAKLAGGRVEVSAAAVPAGHPVTALKLLVDGRPHGEARTVRAVADPRESWAVELPPGPHRLAVVAATAVSQGVSDEVEVTVAPPTGVEKPVATLHLVAVGINAYPGKLALDCAVPDAKAIAEAFRTHAGGLYDARTTLLLDKEATRAGILKALDDLGRRAKVGDLALVYYSGHGDAKAAGGFHILPADVDPRRLAETGISGDELRERLAKLPCTVGLIMDCCYAGSFDAPNKGVKKRAMPAGAGDVIRDALREDQGLVVMCGACKEQESAEEAKIGHGYFTLALTEALAGKAQRSPRDGLVYYHSLEAYVIDRVRELSNGEQEPTFGKPTLVRSFPLSKPK